QPQLTTGRHQGEREERAAAGLPYDQVSGQRGHLPGRRPAPAAARLGRADPARGATARTVRRTPPHATGGQPTAGCMTRVPTPSPVRVRRYSCHDGNPYLGYKMQADGAGSAGLLAEWCGLGSDEAAWSAPLVTS